MKGLKKVTIAFMLFLCGLVFVGCGNETTTTTTTTVTTTTTTTTQQKLATPTNFTISANGVASWDAVEGALRYRLNFVNNETNASIKRVSEETSIEIASLDLPEAVYNVFIQAVGNGTESDYTAEPVTYEVLPEQAKQVLEGEELIDGLYVKWLGRNEYDSSKKLNMMYHSASSFEFKAVGSEVNVELFATRYSMANSRPYIVVMVDDDYENRVRIGLEQEYTTLNIGQYAPNDGLLHTYSVYKSTESTDSHIGLKKIQTNGELIQEVVYKDRLIEFIAASSSTGYGNLVIGGTKTSANSDCMSAFSYLTARALNADINIYSASGWGVKASQWTSPNSLNLYDAYKKIDFYSTKDWDFTQITPDVIVINLGTNDWSYINQATDANVRAQRVEDFKNQYVDFLNFLHQVYPNTQIIMFYGLMNETNIYGYTEEIYQTAKETIPTLEIIQVQGDGRGAASHPSKESHAQVAELLIAKVKSVMGW